MQAQGFQQYVCVFNIEGKICPILKTSVEGLKESNIKQYLCHMSRNDCIVDECKFFKDCWGDKE
jgi:hypothetical protein